MPEVAAADDLRDDDAPRRPLVSDGYAVAALEAGARWMPNKRTNGDIQVIGGYERIINRTFGFSGELHVGVGYFNLGAQAEASVYSSAGVVQPSLGVGAELLAFPLQPAVTARLGLFFSGLSLEVTYAPGIRYGELDLRFAPLRMLEAFLAYGV
jgi:hypothetical protein